MCSTCSFFFIVLFGIGWKKLRTKGQGQVKQILSVHCREHFHFAVTRLLPVSTKAHCPSRLYAGKLIAQAGFIQATSQLSQVQTAVLCDGMFLFVGLFTPFTFRQDTEKWHTVRDESGNHTRTAKSKMRPDIFTSHSVIKREMLIALTNHPTWLQLQKEEVVPWLLMAPPSSHGAPPCWSPGTYATHPASPWERHPGPCTREHSPGCTGLQRCLGLSE